MVDTDFRKPVLMKLIFFFLNFPGGRIPFISGKYKIRRASLVARMVKSLPAMWEIWVQSLGWEDPLEKEMATHSSTLTWRIPWMEEPGRLWSMGL